jgi:hypothetical protein
MPGKATEVNLRGCIRAQCHLVFGEKDIFTMRTARAARKTVTISTILLAGLAELFVKKLINRKTKWHCIMAGQSYLYPL